METDKQRTVSIKRICQVCGFNVHSTKEEYKAWGRCHAPWGPCGAKVREAQELYQRQLDELNARWAAEEARRR